MYRFLLFLSALICAASLSHAQKVTLVAGGGSGASGPQTEHLKLDKPFAVPFDKAGNMYIGEYGGCQVKKVDSTGALTLVAGTGEKGFGGDDGPAIRAKFNQIHDLVIGPDGNIYVADSTNRRVRKINLKSGIVTTFAGDADGKAKTLIGDGGPAHDANLDGVASLFFDPSGKKLYLSGFSKLVRTIDMNTGIITTLKDIPGGRSIAIDSKGSLYVAGKENLSVRTPEGKVSVLLDKTHTGGEKQPLGDFPKHLGIDAHDNLLICDEQNNRICEYIPATGKLVTIAGTGTAGHEGIGGPPAGLQLDRPHGIYFNPADGAIYVADSWNDRVVKWK